MTIQEKYRQRVGQGATIPSDRAIYAQAFIDCCCDADARTLWPCEPAIAELIDTHLYDVCGIDPAVTKLIDPMDVYFYMDQCDHRTSVINSDGSATCTWGCGQTFAMAN
jgi:hypothetical protein